MLRIGLTGGIASGKSTVARMLAELGAVVVDTDKLAREVVVPGSAAVAAIRARFGPAVVDADGALQRDVLGRIVFSDQPARAWLEALLHPLIRRRAEELAVQAERAGQPAVVFDVPLLFETGWDQSVDRVWTVYVSPATQRKRLADRDRLTAAEIEDRIAAQLPIGDKAGRSDVVINNEGDLNDTLHQVEVAWSEAVQTARSQREGDSR